MGESSNSPKPGQTPRTSRDGLTELQEQMADAAGTAARDAADSVAQAVSAITVAFGLRLAKPIAETAEDLGVVLGEALSNLARERDGDWDDLEVVSVDFDTQD